MSRWIKARMYAHVEVRVPLECSIDLDEFDDWAKESGYDTDTPTGDDLIEFIGSSPDREREVMALAPEADVDVHGVWAAELCDATIVKEEES